jgi:hypothetical protein
MSTSAFRNRSRAAYAVLAFVVLSSGCAYGDLRQVLRAEVASEAKCGEVVVKKQSPFQPGYKENQYLVRGCDVDRIYTCKQEGLVRYGHADCTYAAGATAMKPPPVAAPTPDSSDPNAEPADDMTAPDL